LAGIAKTDWSWAPLVADFNNDGYKDLFVTNGYRRNSRDRDYKNKWDELVSTNELVDISIDEYHSMMTITQLRNYYFENNGDLTFTDRSIEYGLDHTGFSNGGTFADLDKDGDLDIVVNNLQTPAYIYQNNSDLFDSTNYLRIKLVGTKGNSFALGTKVRLKVDDQILYQELTLTRGFQSSVESILHFGLGKHELVEELLVIWSDGRITEVYDLNANQLLIIEQEDANKPSEEIKQISPETIFQELGDQYGADFIHTENDFDDYKREILLPHKMSQLGPGFAVGDVNGDQLEDFYITGAYGQSGGLYIQQANFKFRLSNDQPWGSTLYEETGALLFDADTDGDLDLYIVSGGNEFDKNAINLQDRLFLNDGKGRFVESKSNLPLMTTSGSCVKAGDYDKDGDLDLFVGGRQVPGKYPFPARSYLLRNDGGRFTDVTSDIAPGLLEPGMVSSTVWTDFDNDGQLDLIIVGEWMPITIFKNSNGMFKNITKESGLSNTTGWWNKIIEGDFDNDSDPDYVIGNLGLNYKYKATEKEPLHVYCHDFDNNGTLDIVLGYYNNGECYPVRGRECSSDQMPVIADRFPTYDAFGRANLADIYGSNLESALHYEATLFASSYMENLGNGQFSLNNLPVESQFSAVFGIVANDFNQDGNLDLLISGNFFVSEIETGRADASIGLYMTGNGNGEFQAVKVTESGFNTPLDVRDMVMLGSATDGSILILVANNNDKMQMFRTTLSASVQQ
ncbi:MAG: VCBS repeat-containing protein, partial [Bacteroidetes bacterium]|nr:VCBS repeat-containing protein [Bacteroidota bacterium]